MGNKKRNFKRNILDEIISAAPEIIFSPFKIVIWVFRGIGKMISNVLDSF